MSSKIVEPQFKKGDRVILARVRHEKFRGISGVVVRFVKKHKAYDIELADKSRYRADMENVDADTGLDPQVQAGINAGKHYQRHYEIDHRISGRVLYSPAEWLNYYGLMHTSHPEDTVFVDAFNQTIIKKS